MPRIEIDIEALVVDGLDVSHGEGLVEAMQEEIARLARSRRVPARSGASERARASLQVDGRSATALGRVLARIVWAECMGGGASPEGGSR